MDRLLGIVVDVENLFMCVHKEEDSDTKQVFSPSKTELDWNEDASIIKIHIVIEDIEFLSPRSISTCSNCSVDAFYSSPSLRWKDLSGHLLMKSPVLPRASPTSFSTSSTTCRQKNGR